MKSLNKLLGFTPKKLTRAEKLALAFNSAVDSAKAKSTATANASKEALAFVKSLRIVSIKNK